MPRKYTETFDTGSNGWLLWFAGGGGPLPSMIRKGALVARSPWGVDFNHAKPGAGYLHLLYCLPMMPRDKYPYERLEPFCGKNRFVDGKYSTNLTNARITTRLKGDVDLKGSRLMLLVQSDVGPIRTNWVLDKQPIPITKRYREHTITVTPDESQWTCLGTRGKGADCDHYGTAPISEAIKDITVNIIFVLFPLDVQPFNKINGDKDELRAGKDYGVNRLLLPEGEVHLDTVTIEWP